MVTIFFIIIVIITIVGMNAVRDGKSFLSDKPKALLILNTILFVFFAAPIIPHWDYKWNDPLIELLYYIFL